MRLRLLALLLLCLPTARADDGRPAPAAKAKNLVTIRVTSFEYSDKEKYKPYPVDVIVQRGEATLSNLTPVGDITDVTRTRKNGDDFVAVITVPKGAPIRLVVSAGAEVVPEVIGLSTRDGGEQRLELSVVKLANYDAFARRNPGSATALEKFTVARAALGDPVGKPAVRQVKQTLDPKRALNPQVLLLDALRRGVRDADLKIGKKPFSVPDAVLVDLSKLGKPSALPAAAFVLRGGPGSIGTLPFVTGVETGYLGFKARCGVFASSKVGSGLALKANRVVIYIPWDGDEPGTPEVLVANTPDALGFFRYLGSGTGFYLVF